MSEPDLGASRPASSPEDETTSGAGFLEKVLRAAHRREVPEPLRGLDDPPPDESDVGPAGPDDRLTSVPDDIDQVVEPVAEPGPAEQVVPPEAEGLVFGPTGRRLPHLP